MFGTSFFKQFRSPPDRSGSAAARRWRSCRPRLEGLEDRLAPATLDVTGGALTYTAGNGVNNHLTVALAAGTYTFTDSETITLTAGAQQAGFTAVGPTAMGPSSAVTASLTLALGNGTDTLALGPFDAALPALTVTDGSHAGDAATLAAAGNGLTVNGPVSLTGFATLNVNNAINTSGSQNGNVTLDASDSGGTGLMVGAALNAGGNAVRLSGDPITLGAPVMTGGIVTLIDTGTTGVTESGGVIEGSGTAPAAAGLVLGDTGSSGPFQLGGANKFNALAGSVHGTTSVNDAQALTVLGFATTQNLSLTAAGALTLGDGGNGAQPVSAPGAAVTLNAAGVTESGNATVTAGQLGLQGTGAFTLAGPNLVTTLAANVTGALAFTNTGPLIVGKVNGQSGITSGGNNVTLAVSGGLLALGDASSSGQDLNAAGATVDINTSGLFENHNARIEAASLRLQGTVGFVVNQSNQVSTLAGSVQAPLNFTDGQALTVGSVLGTNGLAGNGANLALAVSGALTLGDGTSTPEDVKASGAGLFVTANGLTEASNSAVTAYGLVLTGSGTFSLTQSNLVQVLAGNVSGPLSYSNGGGLIVGAITSTAGLNAGGGLTLVVGGLLALGDASSTPEPVTAAGATVDVNTEGLFQNGNGPISAGALRLVGTGGFVLNQANAVSLLAADVTAPLSFTDTAGLTLGTVNGTAGVNTHGNNVSFNTAGLTEASGAAVVNTFLLTLAGSGPFNLGQGNQATLLNGTINGTLSYFNVPPLIVGGFNTNGHNLTLACNGLLALGDATPTAETIAAAGATIDILAAGAFENAKAALVSGALRLQGGSTGAGFALGKANVVGTLAANIVNSLVFEDVAALVAGTVLNTAGVVTAAGSITLTADTMSLSGPVQGTQDLTLDTVTPSQNILLTGRNFTGEPTLVLSSSDIAHIQPGFMLIIIGQSSGSGTIQVGGPVFFPASVDLRTTGMVSNVTAISVPKGDTVTVNGHSP